MREREKEGQKICSPTDAMSCALYNGAKICTANVIGVKRKYANIINGLVLRLEMFQMHSHEFRGMDGWG